MYVETVRDLKRVLPRVSCGRQMLPTVKQLREGEVPIMRRRYFGTEDILTVYVSGVVSYVTAHAGTVFRIHDVADEYYSQLDGCDGDEIPWDIHLMLVADDRIFHNDSLKTLKHKAKFTDRYGEYMDQEDVFIDQSLLNESAEEEYLSSQLMNTVYSLLSDRQQAVVRLIYEEGYTHAEIADELHISRSTVSMTHKRALEQLRKYTEELLS